MSTEERDSTAADARQFLDRLAAGDHLEPRAFDAFGIASHPADGIETVLVLSFAMSLKRIADSLDALRRNGIATH